MRAGAGGLCYDHIALQFHTRADRVCDGASTSANPHPSAEHSREQAVPPFSPEIQQKGMEQEMASVCGPGSLPQVSFPGKIPIFDPR